MASTDFCNEDGFAALLNCLTVDMGELTTFSAFSKETLDLLEEDESLIALIYVVVSVILCLGVAYLGEAALVSIR